ncbi:MAG: DUF3137 domain-containing protein [Candidatus Diapherotrites archaeon]|nr:DUF3137 domain-containing protein [Candidatus Diapherotrites archaeon]
MSIDLTAAGIYGAIILFIVAIIGIAIYVNKKRADSMDAFAKSIGFQLERSAVGMIKGMNGTYEGQPVRVNWSHESAGESRHEVTKVSAGFSSKSQIHIRITPESILSAAGKVIGMQDITFGDPEFDSKYAITANSELTARRVLDVELRRALMKARFSSVDVKANQVLIKVYKGEYNTDALKALIACAAMLARKAGEQ